MLDSNVANSDRGRLRFPTRLRLRLTIAFVVVAGLTALLLSVGCYFVVQEQRYRSFIDRSRSQARIALALTQGTFSASQVDALVAPARARNNFATMVVADHVLSSSPDLTLSDLPVEVRHDSNGVTTTQFNLHHTQSLLVAADVPHSPNHARLYMVFSEQAVVNDLRELREVLTAGCLSAILVAAAVGNLVAKRTLAPIRHSADAAKAITEGILATRLLESGGNDEFGLWARTFNEMAGALESKINELSAAHERERRFTADVAHDLRTPITGMVNASSLLSEHLGNLPEEAKRPAELLIRDVARIRKLVADLLELGQLDSNTEVTHATETTLNEIINNAIGYAGIDRPPAIEVEECALICDRLRIERILANLLSNAEVHGHGVASLRAIVDDGVLTVCVSDNGPGIPPADLQTIFNRFHKSDTSRMGPGSGLGLAIAANHASVMGAELSAFNSADGGAEFRLLVPVVSIWSGKTDKARV